MQPYLSTMLAQHYRCSLLSRDITLQLLFTTCNTQQISLQSSTHIPRLQTNSTAINIRAVPGFNLVLLEHHYTLNSVSCYHCAANEQHNYKENPDSTYAGIGQSFYFTPVRVARGYPNRNVPNMVKIPLN